MGSKNTTKPVLGCDITPASRTVTIPPGRGGAGRQSPGRQRRREEPGGCRTGGAWWDTGHSHYGGPRWSRQREEPWRRNGRRLQGADQRWWSRWWRSPRCRRRAEEQGRRRRSGGNKAEQMVPANEAQPEEWIPEAWDGRRQTKAELEGRGITAEPVDRWVIHTTETKHTEKNENKNGG